MTKAQVGPGDSIQNKSNNQFPKELNLLKLKTIVFPNPSTDFLFIEFEKGISGAVLLELFNNVGQKILSKTCDVGNVRQKEKLDLNGLLKGTYYLKVGMENQYALYKIIIN